LPRRVLMASSRSSNTSDHLVPPPSPYPATVDPSPVDSNGTNHTDHTEVGIVIVASRCVARRELAGLTPPQIEDDAQENQVSEDGTSDIKSPGTEDMISPVSQGSRVMVCDHDALTHHIEASAAAN
jgi:hypothetical protein